ncbi:MAG: lysophospholipid acyltransferase family protein [Planctomycetota bacterium]|nr:lysophospholipid acyltransferase family protein [Planctomycetota bacterium]
MTRLRAALRLLGLAAILAPLYPLLVAARLLERPAPRAALLLRTRLTRAWARASLAIMGVRVERVGEAPRSPFLAVGNHLSWLDILVLLSQLEARFVSKAEVAGWPLAGHLASLAGTLYLNRERKRDLKRAGSELSRALAAGEGVIVFPEGTSTRGSSVLQFRPSLFQVAAEASIPVAPFTLHYATDRDQPPAHLAVCWWGEMAFAPHFWGALQLRSVRARLWFSEQRLEGEDRKQLAAQAHACVTSAFSSCVVA